MPPFSGTGPARGGRRLNARGAGGGGPAPLLQVAGLRVGLPGAAGLAVAGLDLHVAAGEAVAVVGASGSGKSTTALALARLLPAAAVVTADRLRLGGLDLLSLDERGMAAVRGRRIAIAFQDGAGALHPTRTIGDQVAEAVLRRRAVGWRAARAAAVEALAAVGLPGAGERARAYPHELSGGGCQRVMLAIALALQPDLLVADEPTASLDPTGAARVLDRLEAEQVGRGMAVLLLTHDLGVAAGFARRLAVMHAGRVVEAGPVAAVFAQPRHPYTARLLAAAPRLQGPPVPAVLEPDPPPPPHGCAYAAACPFADAHCQAEVPPLLRLLEDAAADGRQVACWHQDRIAPVGGTRHGG